jgi:hypothetical protein
MLYRGILGMKSDVLQSSPKCSLTWPLGARSNVEKKTKGRSKEKGKGKGKEKCRNAEMMQLAKRNAKRIKRIKTQTQSETRNKPLLLLVATPVSGVVLVVVLSVLVIVFVVLSTVAVLAAGAGAAHVLAILSMRGHLLPAASTMLLLAVIGAAPVGTI